MPDWFKPGATPPTAGTLPAKPGTADKPGRPGIKPPGDRPVATPPIADGKPGRPPVAGGKPPGTRPPVAGKPGRPPGVRPPGSRPPGLVPPPGRPQRPWYPSHPHYQSSDRWWKWATATAVTGWVVHRWAKPVYYRYGTGGNVYYDNNVVYVNGQQYGSPDQYYTEVSGIADAVPETTEEQANADDWMPLGVFALTAEGVNATSMYLQLAIRKDGMIAGTFYNESTSVSHPVEGMVDEKTQRAVWKAADGTNSDLVMETGVYNLSEDQANVLVHFGPERTQTVLLVRLEESEAPQPQE